jgi:death-on-curing protein
MNAPRFLSLEQVAELHRLSFELHGGQDGLRDPAAFAAAVYQPQNTWFYGRGDLYDVAAAYAYHLAESQSCLDGNKRTGMAAALVFLRRAASGDDRDCRAPVGQGRPRRTP